MNKQTRTRISAGLAALVATAGFTLITPAPAHADAGSDAAELIAMGLNSYGPCANSYRGPEQMCMNP